MANKDFETSKKISKLRGTGLCEGNPPMTGGFPSPRASNAENVSIWWRHRVIKILPSTEVIITVPVPANVCICLHNTLSPVYTNQNIQNFVALCNYPHMDIHWLVANFIDIKHLQRCLPDIAIIIFHYKYPDSSSSSVISYKPLCSMGIAFINYMYLHQKWLMCFFYANKLVFRTHLSLSNKTHYD